MPNSVLNVKAVIGAFNQAETLIGAFSMIVQLHRLIVYSTSDNIGGKEARNCGVPGGALWPGNDL